MTSSYSRRTAAPATHSGRACAAPRAARSPGSRPSSTARMSRSRSSERKPRVVSAGSSVAGQGGAGLVPEAWPASSSRRMTSCSGPLSSRGGGSPASAAASRRTPKPKDWCVRASGVVVVPPSRAVTASRRRAAARRVGESRRHASAGMPSRTARTTRSTATVLLPVPGAPSTRTTGAPAATAARWEGSSDGSEAATTAGRRRTSTPGFHHVAPTPAARPAAGRQYVGRSGSTSWIHASTPPSTSTASTPRARRRSTASAERDPVLQWT